MIKWEKKHSFEVTKNQCEFWCVNNEGKEKEFEVYVERGKPFDVTSLKKLSIKEYFKKVANVSKTRIGLYTDLSNLDYVKYCPVCKSQDSQQSLEIYKAVYHQCYCTHYYVKNRPSEKALSNFYSKDKEYQKTYADKTAIEIRIKEIALPKAEWTIEQYFRINEMPKSDILDVGVTGQWALC